MLTRRLRELEDAGLIERQVIPASPVHVEYHLTSMGLDAEPVLDAVIAWSHRWIAIPPGGGDDAASHPGQREHAARDDGIRPATQASS
jgi:DNA-binding HxlR family transcriptional regulator